MDPKFYVLVTSPVYGYYLVCCIAELATSNIQNWWNILIFVSMIWSVVYYSVLYKLFNSLQRRRSKIQFWILTGIAVVLLVVSTGPGFQKISNDVGSRVYQIVYFTSTLGYLLVLIVNSLLVKLRVFQYEEPFLSLV